MKKLLILLLLISCSDSSDVDEGEYLSEAKSAKGVSLEKYQETAGNRIVHGNPEPAMPGILNNYFTLLGVDSDGDGIRDDVEIFINYLFKEKSHNKIKAFRTYSKTRQKILKYHDHKKLLVKLLDDHTKDGLCIVRQYKGYEARRRGYKLTDLVGNKVVNTWIREFYWSRAMSNRGVYFADLPSGAPQDICRFKYKRTKL